MIAVVRDCITVFEMKICKQYFATLTTFKWGFFHSSTTLWARWKNLKGLIISPTAGGVLADFWVPKGQDKKRDHFSYWHCAPVDHMPSVFTKVGFLTPILGKTVFFSPNTSVSGPILVNFSAFGRPQSLPNYFLGLVCIK